MPFVFARIAERVSLGAYMIVDHVSYCDVISFLGPSSEALRAMPSGLGSAINISGPL